MHGLTPDPGPARSWGRHSALRRFPPARAVPPVVRRNAPRDPAPSRLAYRLHRLWLRPLMRRITRVGLPAFLIMMTAGIWLSDETRRAQISGGLTGLVESIQNRDEFMVRKMTIEGASPVVDKGLRGMLPVTLPASSFDIDLEALRARVLKLDAVESIELRIKPGGILSAVVTERVPVMLWRHSRGIELLDDTGHRVASATSREVRPDLPMIAGEGADRAAAEALLLIDIAGPVLPRLRGLVRVGERRWDLVLDRDQRIMLPADDPLPALERILAQDRALDILGRDVAHLDLRNDSRPTLRMGLDAQNAIRRARGQAELGPDGMPVDPAAKKSAKTRG